MVELCHSGMLDNGSLIDWRGSLGSGWSARSARSEKYGFRTVHTLIQDISVIWRGQFVVDNTNMEWIYLPETVDSVLPASFPGTGSWSSSAEETETRVKFDWLAKSLIDLVRLNRSRTRFTISPPFFFDFFVDEGWSAMEMRVGDLNVWTMNFKLCESVTYGKRVGPG